MPQLQWSTAVDCSSPRGRAGQVTAREVVSERRATKLSEMRRHSKAASFRLGSLAEVEAP